MTWELQEGSPPLPPGVLPCLVPTPAVTQASARDRLVILLASRQLVLPELTAILPGLHPVVPL